jgi:acetoin utilization protein AcuB
MQKSIVTVRPAASLAEAQDLMRGHNIRQIPVTGEDGKLAGILSDRDIRGAVLPAGLIPGFTTEDAERFLRTTAVERVMTRKVVTATLTDTLEDAIVLLHDFNVNALPVVDAEGRVAGIITRVNILEAFIDILGVGEVSSRLEVIVPDRPGTLAQLVAIISSFHVNITSVLATGHVVEGKRANFFRIAALNVAPIKKAIEDAGFEILDPSQYTL